MSSRILAQNQCLLPVLPAGGTVSDTWGALLPVEMAARAGAPPRPACRADETWGHKVQVRCLIQGSRVEWRAPRPRWAASRAGKHKSPEGHHRRYTET